jgi:AraC family transcriptional regulator, regulatory protein of adaptative response / methylated-DNA-[protein]-cysteine methyltransferase
MNAAAPGPERAFDTDEARWQAVSSRQASADGSFVYAVATTGVYCRPSCAARAARRKNVSFHRTPAEAEAAGFRPCKRCRPAGRSQAELRAEAVARACRLIDEAEEPPSLDDLARAAGVSRFYFHRVFKEIVGVTPKAYAAARGCRASFATRRT